MQTHTAPPSHERSEESPRGLAPRSAERAAEPRRVGQLKAFQAGLDQSPRVRRLAQVGTSLNPPAPIQRMEWRKQDDGLVPENTAHTGPEPDARLIPPSLEKHDIWDDVTNNVYDGATGFLRYNHQEDQPGDERIPESLRMDFAGLNKNPNVSSNGTIKSYSGKLNALSRQLTEWLSTQDPEASMRDGTDAAVARLKGRIDAIRSRPVLKASTPKLPAKEADRARLALGGAADRLYAPLTKGEVSARGTARVPRINSSFSEEGTGEETEIDTGDLTPSHDGLAWWASAAMGLRHAALGAPRGLLLQLGVGTGQVPIGVKTRSGSVPEGEFIVMGHGAPIAHDESPSQQGLRTPGNADKQYRVSYPAFLERLGDLQHVTGVGDAVLAQAMLTMVKTPGADPDGVPAEFLPLLREMLVTWMVAEPARHRSVIFNSVLSLQEIASGAQTFGDMLPDDGRYPMAGKGTAKAGRTAEAQEKKLLTGGAVAPTSKVEERQKDQLKRTSTDEDFSSPLEQVLHDHGFAGPRLRYVPTTTT